ncbi:MAG: hypothetical protein ITG02_02755, partial [Patulibacter sp.]|nr:hypothetical protein [Patulibacter sp.]
MPSLSGPQWGCLHTMLATGSPIMVLGPGCHRIGYEQTKGWEEVSRRVSLVRSRTAEWFVEEDPESAQRFLDGFWLSKLSDQPSENDRSEGRLRAIRDAPDSAPRTPLDLCRTELATAVLGVLFEGTRCLGSEIATGRVPVIAWQEIAHRAPAATVGEPRNSVSSDEATSPPFVSQDADVRHARASDHMCRAVRVAEAVEALAADDRQLSIDRRAVVESILTEDAELDEDEIERLKNVLQIGTVRYVLAQLRDECFARPGSRVTGAVIEWLADLLWHLFTTDSRVPPSQAEVAFYVNLQETDSGRGRPFARSRPGESRRRLDERSTQGQIARMIATYDNGVEAWTDIAEPRRAFTRAICAALLEQWNQQPEIDAEEEITPVLALVPDFDLSFERTLLELMGKGGVVHLVLPVWRKPKGESPFLDWVIGTMVRSATDPARRGGKLPTVE